MVVNKIDAWGFEIISSTIKLEGSQGRPKKYFDIVHKYIDYDREPFAFEDEERIEIIVGGLDGDGEGLVD